MLNEWVYINIAVIADGVKVLGMSTLLVFFNKSNVDGPEVVKIIPAFNGTVTIHDGAFFGPVTCTADCSPPCQYQWREVTWNGDINDVINASTLPQQVVHAGGVSKYYCVATGFHGTSYSTTTVSREISLNIQCKFDSMLCLLNIIKACLLIVVICRNSHQV